MTHIIPSLKRVKITSVADLEVWLRKAPPEPRQIMLVTYVKVCGDRHVSTDAVQQALAAQGWEAGRRFTLNTTLIGHVISRAAGGETD